MKQQNRFWTLVAAGALVCAAAAPAFAQDARVRVKIDPDDVGKIVRDVMQGIHESIGPDLGQGIADAVRGATSGLGALGRIGPPFVRGAAQNPDFRVRQEQRDTKTLKLGAAGALELKNVSGDITVAAGAGNEAVVEIVRVSHGRTDADAKLGLDRVTVDVTQVGDRATVQTHYPDERRPPYSVQVEYHVKAPAGTRMTISSIGGSITVNDIRGETSVSTTGGNATLTNARARSINSVGGSVTLTGVESEGVLDVESIGGHIVMKQIKAKRLQASSVGGNITAQDVAVESADLGNTGGNVEFSGPLAKSGRYELHTFGGAVRFSPTGGAGYELQASTFAGEIRTEGVTVQVQGAVAGRGLNKSLKGTVGDGSALVILRTFSGSVVIGSRK